jgi:hypothetical protein
MVPHMESAIIAVVQKMSLDGLKQQEPWLSPVFSGDGRNQCELRSLWSRQGVSTENDPCPAEEIVDDVVGLFTPLVHPVTPSISEPRLSPEQPGSRPFPKRLRARTSIQEIA